MSKVFLLASVELCLVKSKKGGGWGVWCAEITVRQATFSSPAGRQAKISVTNSILPNTVMMSGR